MALATRAPRGRPDALIQAGLGFEVVTAFLIAAFSWWEPFGGFGLGVSWVCVVILVYPSIAPASPSRTLAAAAGPPGFEPGLPAPKAGVLPLDEGPGSSPGNQGRHPRSCADARATVNRRRVPP
jgi:hypothetical protein